jgi:putative hydrolase of the HAD superfamily
MAERRGLLVDWGGVLTTDVFRSFASFCTSEGLAPETARDLFRGSDEGRRLLHELETGVLSEAAFGRAFAEVLGLAAERGEGLVDRMFAALRPDEEMVAAVRAVRAAGVPTGMVSNSWGRDRYTSEALALFDAVVISGDEGIRKPHPRMYELGAQRLGLPPEACVYVDDLGGNLKPARALGMATIRHTDAATTIAEIERLLGVPPAQARRRR